MNLIILAVYLGIGAILHALFVGAQFDWSSAWTFGWLLGWPIMLFMASWVLALGGLLVACLCWAGWEWLKIIATWRKKRRTESKRQ